MDAHERRTLPEGWEIVNLPEIVFFQEGPGVRKHQFTTEGIKLINVGNLANNELVLDNTETCISKEEATTKYKHFLVDEGDLIIATSGIKVDYFHKKIAFAKREHLPLCMNTSTIRFKALNKNKISMKFFRYFLMTRFFTKQVQFHITGSAQLNFGPSHLEKMKVILPPLEIQNKIVYVLEKAEETKRLRAQADELTNRLLQSLFLEMFGDPVRNPKGWEVVRLEDICSEIYRYPTFYGFEYSKIGVPVVRINNIGSDGSLDPDVSNYVLIEPKLNKIFPRTILEINDIVMAVRGDGSTAKRIGLVNTINLVGANISPNLIRFKANVVILNPLYLFNLMTSDSGQKLLGKYVTRTAKKTITAKDIKEIPIPLPPLPLQQKFARIVEKIESMRRSQNQSKQQIEDLFSALMQKAFRGEL